jgi:predicted nucleotidyltransferase
MTEHKNNSEKDSVETNLSKSYVPNSKIPSFASNQISEALKMKMDKTQKEIEKYKDVITKKYKFIESIGIIPVGASKIIEEEYEISPEETKKELIHIVTIIPEAQFKNIAQIRLDAISEAKKINDKFWIHVLTPVDYWNLGLDSKFDTMEAIAMAYPILDKSFLLKSRVTQIHKSLVLKKFEKYVTSYVVGGSITTGTTKKDSDIDVFVIIDDTDVKRMPRLELKEKLRGIIYSYIQEAEAVAGVEKNTLNVQIYLMTEFWEAVKDAHPVMFTFIRDGIPLYDRGTFLPWKSLLKMGKIKPSPEAIDMFMSSGNKLKETVERRIFDIATLDLFWGINTPTQGLLMLYGLAPPNVYETVKQFREVFVNKEKLIEAKYADILEEIVLGVWKKYEHGKIKPGDINGKDLDRLSKDAIEYFKRLKELRAQIEKRIQEKSIEQIYKDVFGMLGSILGKRGELEILKEFEKRMIKTGKLPPRFLDNLKLISKTKKEVVADKSKKKGQGKERSKDVDEARKLAAEITQTLVEYSQRCELASAERSRFFIKGQEGDAEVFFLKNTFIIQKGKIQKLSGSKLVSATLKELQEQLSDKPNKETKIDSRDLETLNKAFGKFELIY